MANFQKAFKNLIIIEGGYVNNPHDPGGKTTYGITETVARDFGYTGKMEDLPLKLAEEIYMKQYWSPYKFDLIKNSKIAGELFEFTVNTGNGKLASKILQRSYNLLNKNIFLEEDGIIGPHTANTVNSYKFYKSLFKVMNIFQGQFYIALAENDSELMDNLKKHVQTSGHEKRKTFIRGWLDKRVSI
jgi:lysozyme family protein